MAMLAIPISQDISRLFREIEIDANRDSSDHISLFYFGDNLPIQKILKIIPIVFDICSIKRPFEVTCSKIISFPKGKHGYPIVAEIKSEELEDIRNSIKKLFNKKNIKYEDNFPEFRPHITLGYSENEPKDIKFEKVKWAISQVGLYGGDTADSKIFVNFPFTLGTSKVEKTAKYIHSYLKYCSE